MKLKKFIAMLMAVSMVGVNVYAVETTEQEFTGTIDIIHTSDMHGSAEGTDEYMGYGKIAGYVDSVRAENDNTLLLDTGDTYEGLSYSNITKGDSVAPVLKAMKYDAMTLGNHEFSYSTEIRNALIEKAGIPVVSANITDIEGNLLYDEYIIKEYDSLKVGIFGLTTETTKTSAFAKNVAGIEFQNVTESAEKAVADLEAEGCDYIIAICHLGSAETENEVSIKVAESVDGIDLMLDGHSHVVNDGTMYGDTLLVASGYYGSTLGHVTVEFENGEPKTPQVKMNTIADLADVEPNAEVEGIVSEYVQKTAEFFNTVVATTDIDWIGDTKIVRSQPTNLATLVAESYRVSGNADIGIVNGGGIRQSISAGDVTNQNLFDVQPFGNTIGKYSIKGEYIDDVFKQMLSLRSTGQYLHFSGIKADYDGTTNELLSISLADGTPIDENKEYSVVTSNYLAAHADLTALSSNVVHIEDIGIDFDITAEYVLKNGMVKLPALVRDIAITPDTEYEESTQITTNEESSTKATLSGSGSSSSKATGENTEENETTDGEVKTEIKKNNNSFTDVNKTDWFYESVEYAYENGIFKGITDTEFAPQMPVTRAMVVAILYRMENSPEVQGNSSFSDVRESAYYNNAVIWAEENGIVKGYNDNTFAPDKAITREEMVTILKRYADLKGVFAGNEKEISDFADSDNVSQWAEDAVAWAVGNEIIKGRNGNVIAPDDEITRAETATVIYRFVA